MIKNSAGEKVSAKERAKQILWHGIEFAASKVEDPDLTDREMEKVNEQIIKLYNRVKKILAPAK